MESFFTKTSEDKENFCRLITEKRESAILNLSKKHLDDHVNADFIVSLNKLAQAFNPSIETDHSDFHSLQVKFLGANARLGSNIQSTIDLANEPTHIALLAGKKRSKKRLSKHVSTKKERSNSFVKFVESSAEKTAINSPEAKI